MLKEKIGTQLRRSPPGSERMGTQIGAPITPPMDTQYGHPHLGG